MLGNQYTIAVDTSVIVHTVYITINNTMRAREFIPESAREFSDKKSGPMSRTQAFPDLPSNNPYLAYRFGMAMANEKMQHTTGPTDEFAVIVAYSKGEEEIIDQAAKKMGIKGRTVSDRGSREPRDTEYTSPVAKKSRNRWGI